jgi:hypothetical protein
MNRYANLCSLFSFDVHSNKTSLTHFHSPPFLPSFLLGILPRRTSEKITVGGRD